MNDQIRTIAVNGRWARVRVAGDPANPTVVLLHGITRSLEDWDDVVGPLAEQFQVIVPDLPGYGWSSPHPGGAGLEALANGVGELLDTLGVRGPIHVAGNSLGGAVTMTLLTQRPTQVASMTLADPAGFGTEVTPLLRLLGIPLLGRIIATTASLPSAIIQERLIYADKSFATRKRVDHALKIARETDAGMTAWRTAGILGAVLTGISAQWRTELLSKVAKNPVPTLVLWGDRDKVLPPKQLDAARAALPDAQTHLIPGVGHMPQIECAPQFVALFSDFVAQHASSEQRSAVS